MTDDLSRILVDLARQCDRVDALGHSWAVIPVSSARTLLEALSMQRPPLTRRQKGIYDAVRDHIAEHGVPPTYAEIAAAVGLKSQAGIMEYIDTLERKRYLRRPAGRGMNIRGNLALVEPVLP